jgi:hypothetical protein
MMKFLSAAFGFVLLFSISFSSKLHAQGTVSGDLELFQNFFFLDSNLLSQPIPPQYFQQLSSTDAWLNLKYRSKDIEVGVRFDLFLNSGLRTPGAVQNNQGIGFWYARKQIEKLQLTVGYFYDQFGSGAIFRAYEGRGQNLDYAIRGLHAKYDISPDWQVKAFVGRQKFLFETYQSVMKGINLEGTQSLGDELLIRPGLGVVNRTLDRNSMDLIVGQIENQPIGTRFVPKFNAFAYSAYNTIDYKGFSWYVEYAGKTSEAVFNREGDRMVNKPGSMILSSLSYSQPGIGGTFQYKRTSFFEFRTSPLESLNDGLINFIPPSARMNTYRLTSRYAPPTQLIGEQGFQGDLVVTIAKKHNIQFNASDVKDLDGKRLYQEFYVEGKVKISPKFIAMAGLQRLIYNQEVYENKPGKPLVKTWTPFSELTYKFNRKHSLRAELSHMQTHQDLGSWWWGLLEYNIAPKYSFSVMDMWNYGNKDPKKRIHYWTVFGAMNVQKLRITGGYVRQVEGVICTGGVCRIEPAFNGVRLSLSSNF